MSIETLTTDEFMDLEIEDHQEALLQYSNSIFSASRDLHDNVPESEAWNALLDRIGRLSTLRKVHKVRLEEMQADEAAEAAEILGSSVPCQAAA
jgi:hypothetical protein